MPLGIYTRTTIQSEIDGKERNEQKESYCAVSFLCETHPPVDLDITNALVIQLCLQLGSIQNNCLYIYYNFNNWQLKYCCLYL